MASFFKRHKHTETKRMFDVGNVIKAVVSLVLVVALTMTATYSWFTTNISKIDSTNFTLSCGKQLRVNDSGITDLSFSYNEQYLKPCSSVDGRNIFFPNDGTDFSATTNSMTFRSANVGDKNRNYIQIDFTLTAQSDHTALYINSKETKLEVADSTSNHYDADYSVQRAAPLRAALWCENNEDNAPVVFNPLAKKVITPAVNEVDRATGNDVYTAAQTAYAFSDYDADSGHAVAVLNAGEVTHFSYIIWLEGADPKCTYEKIAGKDIRASIAFTTSWDHVEKIRLRDSSSNTWIKNAYDNNHYNLSLRHTYTKTVNNSTVTLYDDYTMISYPGTTNEWFCSLPRDITEGISFILRPTSASEGDNLQTYTFDRDESNNPTTNRHHNRLYTVESLPAGTPSQCQGHWVALGDSEGGGSHTGDIDGDDF